MARKRVFKKPLLGIGAVLVALAVLFCVLMEISARMQNPFLPTWDEIYIALGLKSEPVDLEGELRIDVIDVGNADAILIRSQDKSLLIDAGEKKTQDRLLSYLTGQGIRRLDYVIATHPDADHIGGMAAVINQWEIGTFIMAFMPEGYTPTTKVYEDMLTALLEKDVEITPAEAGQQYKLAEAVIDILGPVEDFTESNNQSVVCKVTFGNRRFLFMGDAEKEAEDALMDAGTDLSADVIKLGHHGSHSSSQRTFLKMVGAKTALITCGAGNSYGHPHEETLQVLKERNMTVYRCDWHGTIVMTCDGNEIVIQTEK